MHLYRCRRRRLGCVLASLLVLLLCVVAYLRVFDSIFSFAPLPLVSNILLNNERDKFQAISIFDVQLAP